MTKPTGFYDMHGIPIHVGDLIRVKHYRHRRNRRQMWMYFVVKQVEVCGCRRTVVQHWEDIRKDGWQCLLQDCGVRESEVLSESGLERNERGEIQTFNERKRRKRGEA